MTHHFFHPVACAESTYIDLLNIALKIHSETVYQIEAGNATSKSPRTTHHGVPDAKGKGGRCHRVERLAVVKGFRSH